MPIKPSNYNPTNMAINTFWRFFHFFLWHQPDEEAQIPGKPRIIRCVHTTCLTGQSRSTFRIPWSSSETVYDRISQYWHNCQISHWMMIAAADFWQNIPKVARKHTLIWSWRFFTGLPRSLPEFNQNVIEEGVSCAFIQGKSHQQKKSQ